MDYTLFIMSAFAVFVVLFIAGMIISLISTQLQCSKYAISTAFKQGLTSAVSPTIMYCFAAAFLFIRNPFASTFQMVGVGQDTSQVLAVGYVIMLLMWITAVWNVHNSAAVVCQSNLKEMSDFKKKMLAGLAEKEKIKARNAAFKK